MIASVGLTAALRAAATPLFNQDFYAELRMTLKRHKNLVFANWGCYNQIAAAKSTATTTGLCKLRIYML